MATGQKADTKKRRYVRTIISVLIILLGLIIALVLLLPQFYFHNLEIIGNETLSDEEIAAALQLEPKEHLLANVSGGFFERLTGRYTKQEQWLKEDFPYIKELKIKAQIPATVQVEIVERVPIYYIAHNESFYLLDDEAYVLDELNTKPSNLVQLIGVSTRELRPGEKLDLEEEGRLTLANHFLATLGGQEIDLVENLEFIYPVSRNSLYVSFRGLEQEGAQEGASTEKLDLKIKFTPDETLQEKLIWFAKAYKQNLFYDLPAGILDLSTEQHIFSPSETVPPVTSETTSEQTTSKSEAGTSEQSSEEAEES